MSIRQTFRPAIHLLANGFTVVRFEPTDYAADESAGLSDGHMADFTLTGLAGDLSQVARWARDRFEVASVGVFAFSLGARAALRAAGRERGLLRIVGSIACVVDVRETFAAVMAERAPLARWYAGDMPGGDAGQADPHHRRVARGLDSAFAHGWVASDAAVSDLVAADGTRFVNVHGARDRIVGVGRVLSTFGAAPDTRVVLIPGAGHDLSLAHTVRALAVLVPEYRAALQAGQPHGPVREPTVSDVVAHRRLEKETIRRLSAAGQGPGRLPAYPPGR